MFTKSIPSGRDGYFAYVRISTPRQGRGVSLEEQRQAIGSRAAQSGLAISRWFEEQESAALKGRPVFAQLLRSLRAGRARGVILHKVDRGARNLRDWLAIEDLVDRGIEVHSPATGSTSPRGAPPSERISRRR